MTRSDLEKSFDQAMAQVYQRAKKEVGYTASRFAQMLGEHGGLKTAKLLLQSNTVSDGFVTLWESKRLDLAVESQVLLPEFQPLFTEDELARAKDRLEEYAASVPGGGVGRGRKETLRKSKNGSAIETVAPGPSAPEQEAPLIEISRRRNAIETKLRDVLAQGLRFEHGPKAPAVLVGCLAETRRPAVIGKSYADMWTALYFGELRDVVYKEWRAFSGWFGADKDKVLNWFDHVNKYRADAHAKSISDEDLAYLRVCFKRLEEALGLS